MGPKVVRVSRPVAFLAEATRATIPPFHVMDVWAAAGERQRTHGDLVNLSAGQPSTPAPRPVRAAAVAALEREVLGYTVALGLPELRAGVAGHYGHVHGLPVDPAEVVLLREIRDLIAHQSELVQVGGAGGAAVAGMAPMAPVSPVAPGERVADRDGGARPAR